MIDLSLCQKDCDNTSFYDSLVLHRLVRRDLWNKCDVCGRIIPYADLESGKAIHNMKTPDSEVSFETWETLCRDHYQPNVQAHRHGGAEAPLEQGACEPASTVQSDTAAPCSVQRFVLPIDSTRNVGSQGFEKHRFIMEWESAGKPKLYFVPQQDITAWELAQIHLLTLSGTSPSRVYNLEESCFRHLQPSWKPTANKSQSKSASGQVETSSNKIGLLSCLSRLLRGY